MSSKPTSSEFLLRGRDCFLCVGRGNGIKSGFASRPERFHEELCRKSFRQDPVFGAAKGCQAQRALIHGGTLANGKVAVEVRWTHGRKLRELIAKVRFEPNEDVSCYGGFLQQAPSETDRHTHMRHVPLTDYVLEGQPFAGCFPVEEGFTKFTLGVPLSPRCGDPAWDQVITSNGIGYMANTVTKCPLRSRSRTNVTVCEAQLGRAVPGVPYSSVLVLRASDGGIDIGQPVISPYEPWKLKKTFEFKCADAEHYRAAGHVQADSDGDTGPEPDMDEEPDSETEPTKD